jgi:transposase
MQVRKGKPPGSSRLARIGVEFSREARVRLAWMDFYRRNRNPARTCRYFGISRQTFYRWQRRYDPHDLSTLESRTHRPHRQRQPTWTFPLAEKLLTLRLQFPRWGKDKLAILLCRQHLRVSTSMVGRILTQLKQQGRLVEPPAPAFQDRGALCDPVLTRCENPNSMQPSSPAIWSKSIPWTCVRYPAWSSNSSPHATWSRVGM